MDRITKVALRPRSRLLGAAVSLAMLATMLPLAGAAMAAAPSAPSTPDLAPASDTGYSQTDNITKILDGLVFTGTATPSATVDIYGGGILIGSDTATTSGTYSVTTTTALPDNATTAITATATNADGTSDASGELTVITDNTVPGAPGQPDLTPASDTGISNSDDITGDTTPTFTGTSEVHATVVLYAQAGSGSPAQVGTALPTTTGAGTWTITSTALAAGTYTFTAVQTDAAGNGPSDASSGLAVTIDTTVPAAPSQPDLASASDTGVSNSDNITNDTTPTFTGTAPAGTLVTLYAGSTPVGTTTASSNGAWSITSTTLTAGTYTFTATATGLAGSSAASPGLPVSILTAAPTVTVNQAATQNDPTGVSPISFTVIFSSAATGFTSGDVTVGGTAPGTKSVAVTGSGTTYTVAVSGMTGAGTVTASIAANKVQDYAGNWNLASTSTDNTVTYDPTAGPTVTINQASGQVDPTAAMPVNFTVVFSASVTGFSGADVTTGGTAPGTRTVTVTGSGTTYTVAVSGMTGSGTVTASLPADAAVSVVGNHPSRASTSTDNTVTYLKPARWVVTASTYSPTPGATITISAQLVDASGAAVPVSGIPVTWSKSLASGTLSALSSLTNASGVASVGFTVAAVTGTVYTVTATGNGLTGTSPAITVVAFPAQITLTASSGVVTWGRPVTITAQFAASGAGKSVALQTTTDLATWVTTASLTANAYGTATFTWSPARNLWYRAVFAGTPDLSAANSNAVRVVVRQIALLRPTNSGRIRTIAAGSNVTFTTTVRPARPELPKAKVTFTFTLYRAGHVVYSGKRDVYIDAYGLARWTWTFGSSGLWYVRAIANPTTTNANSTWSQIEKYYVP